MENQHNSKPEGKPEKTTTIIVNGREKEWTKKEISFRDLIILAFGNYQDNGTACYTVTYTRGQNDKPQGSLVDGESVIVKHNMIFNVTATDKS